MTEQLYTVEVKIPKTDEWVKLNDEVFTKEQAIVRYGTWLKEPGCPLRLKPVK